MRRPPAAWMVVMGAVLLVAVLSALVSYNVPPFDTFQVFILTNVTGFFTLLVLAAVGGAAVGMLLSHRILSNRRFTPFERSVLESLADVRERLERLEAQRRGEERPPEAPRR